MGMGGAGLVGCFLCDPTEESRLHHGDRPYVKLEKDKTDDKKWTEVQKENVPKLHHPSCGSGDCPKCGVGAKIRVNVNGTVCSISRFPTSCPVLYGTLTPASENVPPQVNSPAAVHTSELACKIKTYEKVARTGTNTESELVERSVRLRDIFAETLESMAATIRHYCDYSFVNLVRAYHAGTLSKNELVILSDFAAVYSIHAQDRKNTATDKHLILDMFVVLSDPREILVGKSMVKVHTCELIGFWGNTVSKVKKQDELTHTVCLDKILGLHPETDSLVLCTDGAPYTYKCRFAIFQFGVLLLKHQIKKGVWLFAVVGNFKGETMFFFVDFFGSFLWSFLWSFLEDYFWRIIFRFDFFLLLAFS